LFGTKKSFELSANNLNKRERWIQVIDPIAIQQQGAIKFNLMPIDQPSLGNQSIHSKVQAEDNKEPTVAKIDQVDASTSAATGENSATTIYNVQPIVRGQGTRERNINELDDDDDDDNALKRETVEYSTHTPIVTQNQNDYYQQQLASTGTVTPTAGAITSNTVNNNDYHTSVVNVNNNMDDQSKTATTPVGLSHGNRPGGGPTREGSDVFWDTQ
jgi:hypothetical protein